MPVLNGDAALLPAPGSKLFGAGAGSIVGGAIRGARQQERGPGASRYALLDRVRGKRWGELPAALPAGRHTPSGLRFSTEAAAGTAARTRRTRVGEATAQPGVVIIASPSDLLAQLVAMSLMYAHVPTCQLDPGELADVEVEWHGSGVTVNGQPIRGLLWRALQPGGSSMEPTVLASWLAAASFPSVRAINSYDPDAWRQGAGWSVWEDRLGRSGVAVRPPQEQPSTPAGTSSLVVCGEVVCGPDTPEVTAAAGVLAESGVRLASVTSLPDGTVSDVDTQPEIDDSVQARRAVARVTDYLAA
ncbi:MAG: hypothetical protein ACR2OI_09390 [Acidimicrobiia bacterium]